MSGQLAMAACPACKWNVRLRSTMSCHGHRHGAGMGGGGCEGWGRTPAVVAALLGLRAFAQSCGPRRWSPELRRWLGS